MMRVRHRQRGFTLIEMMVVVAIIALLSGFLISVKGSTYGANPQNVAQQAANLFNTCKMRAVSTRRWHRCEITPTGFTMEQWSATGLTTPSGACTPPSTNCWQLISTTPFGTNVIAWNGGSTTTSGASVTLNASLVYDIDFRPDGSSTGGSIYFADVQGVKPWRTVVHRATGGSYARAGW